MRAFGAAVVAGIIHVLQCNNAFSGAGEEEGACIVDRFPVIDHQDFPFPDALALVRENTIAAGTIS